MNNSMTLLGCRFYTECLGMKLLRKRDIPEDGYTNAFLRYGPEDSNFTVELTYSEFRCELYSFYKIIMHVLTTKGIGLLITLAISW